MESLANIFNLQERASPNSKVVALRGGSTNQSSSGYRQVFSFPHMESLGSRSSRNMLDQASTVPTVLVSPFAACPRPSLSAAPTAFLRRFLFAFVSAGESAEGAAGFPGFASVMVSVLAFLTASGFGSLGPYFFFLFLGLSSASSLPALPALSSPSPSSSLLECSSPDPTSSLFLF